jgi:hypothetical protein
MQVTAGIYEGETALFFAIAQQNCKMVLSLLDAEPKL